MKRIVLLMLCLGALVSCVQNEDMVALENRIQAQEQRIDQLDSEVSTTNQAVGEVRPRQADLWAELEEMRVQMASMAGRMDDLSQRVNTLEASDQERARLLAAMEADVKKLKYAWTQTAAQLALDIDMEEAPTAAATPRTDGAAPSGNATMPVASGAADTDAQPAETEAAPAQPDPARALYDRAREQFEARNYAAAQAIWEEFAKTFKDHELVPNAIFWQGECFYQMRDYARAILAYQEVIGKYPKATKYPTALLKQGISFIKIGKEKAGKLLLGDVIKKFPDSPEARRAKKELQQ